MTNISQHENHHPILDGIVTIKGAKRSVQTYARSLVEGDILVLNDYLNRSVDKVTFINAQEVFVTSGENSFTFDESEMVTILKAS